jgi:hypothetical protein
MMLGKRLVPGFVGEHTGVQISVNSHGMRDREYDAQKPAGSLRIMAIGDSWTFGVGMNNQDTWPKRLEALLTTPERPAAVMNTGVSGYETYHEALYYKELAPQFEHDLVLVGIYPVNDVHAKDKKYARYRRLYEISPSAPRPLQRSKAPLRLTALQQLARGAEVSVAARSSTRSATPLQASPAGAQGSLRGGRGGLDRALHRPLLGWRYDAGVVPLDRRDGAEHGRTRRGDPVPGSPRPRALPRLQPSEGRAADPRRGSNRPASS